MSAGPGPFAPTRGAEGVASPVAGPRAADGGGRPTSRLTPVSCRIGDCQAVLLVPLGQERPLPTCAFHHPLETNYPEGW